MSFILNDPNKAIQRAFQKGKSAQEGEIREHGGVKMQKRGEKWIPVSEGKDKKKEDDKGGSKNAKKEEFSPSSHGVAQLTHIKQTIDSDPGKAYEIYQKLDDEAKAAIPQDVVNKMVAGAHTEPEKEKIDYNSLGKKGEGDSKSASESDSKVEDAKKKLGVESKPHQTKDTTQEENRKRFDKIITSVEDNKLLQSETNKALERLGVQTFTSKDHARAQSFALDVVENKKKEEGIKNEPVTAPQGEYPIGTSVRTTVHGQAPETGKVVGYGTSKVYVDTGDGKPKPFSVIDILKQKSATEEATKKVLEKKAKQLFPKDSHFTAVRDTSEGEAGASSSKKKDQGITGDSFTYDEKTDTLYNHGYGTFVVYEKGTWAISKGAESKQLELKRLQNKHVESLPSSINSNLKKAKETLGIL